MNLTLQSMCVFFPSPSFLVYFFHFSPDFIFILFFLTDIQYSEFHVGTKTEWERTLWGSTTSRRRRWRLCSLPTRPPSSGFLSARGMARKSWSPESCASPSPSSASVCQPPPLLSLS